MCVCVWLESLCGYWAGELGCKNVIAHVYEKCNHSQIINKIVSLHTDQSEKKRWGLNSTGKGKGGIKSKGIFY
jgi:hypothetical protein